MISLKHWSITGVLLVAIVWSLGVARADEPKKTYTWVQGPTEARLGDQAILKLSEKYAFLNAQETQRLLKDTGNFPSGEELGMVGPVNQGEEWFVVIRFIESGYVPDEDADHWNADEMLTSIKEGTEEANKKRQELGIGPLVIRGWEEKPHYDKANHKVVWAIAAQEQQWIGVNYNTLTLGRHGYLSMNMVGALEELPKLKPHTNDLLANLNFVEGKRYADFDSATDKVAAVGLGALVAGVALKSGLLAKLWAFILPLLIVGKKLIVLLAIVIGGYLARLWKKRTPATPPRVSPPTV